MFEDTAAAIVALDRVIRQTVPHHQAPTRLAGHQLRQGHHLAHPHRPRIPVRPATRPAPRSQPRPPPPIAARPARRAGGHVDQLLGRWRTAHRSRDGLGDCRAGLTSSRGPEVPCEERDHLPCSKAAKQAVPRSHTGPHAEHEIRPGVAGIDTRGQPRPQRDRCKPGDRPSEDHLPSAQGLATPAGITSRMSQNAPEATLLTSMP
jgi:hypothetical protein